MATDWLETPYDLTGKRIFVAGHTGMVGRAIIRQLQNEDCEILTCPFDLRDQVSAKSWLHDNKPDVVILAAAKVGGILANDTYPADFIHDNLMIQSNVIDGAYEVGVEKLLFLGSSCIYPKDAENPITEDALMSGPLEPTNAPYAMAKLAGIQMCQAYRQQHGCDFIAAIPCNLYGPHDKFDPQDSHVIPALMMKAYEAKISNAPALEVWGSGNPRREFLYVDDLAAALVMLLKTYSSARPINIGAGKDMQIKELAQTICDVVGYEGVLAFDTDKPDGTMQKLMDSSRIINAGWSPSTPLKTGLAQTYQWYLENREQNERAAA